MQSNSDINILIVDDRPDNLLVLESVLEVLDVNIMKATSGNEALSYMLDYDFGLVILDVQMPEMDGFEVADLMKSREKTRHIPIIFLTAISKEEYSIFKGYEVGAVDYLFKPIEPVILRSKVKVFINLYKQKEEIKKQAALLEEKVEELLELKRANWKLENLSQVDGLTGIANRRSLDQYMEKNWEQTLRESAWFSFIMVDIDFFKAYNDNYGHLQGDDCLRRVAKVLTDSTEGSNGFLVARYGGEEFSVVLPHTDPQETERIAELIQRNLHCSGIVHEYSPLSPHLTVSMGTVSLIPTSSLTIEGFIDRADKALYVAKKLGRNQAVNFESMSGETFLCSG